MRLSSSFLVSSCLLTSYTRAQANATVPQYVLDYAPLVYLDVNEEFYPSDIAAQLLHTNPTLNFSAITNGPSNLTLSDLTALNSIASCTGFSDCDLYLTSKDKITVKPTEDWLRGVLPNPVSGETDGATSCTVIVTDHNNGTVDAFYMFFYAFNYGIPVGNPNGTVYDDHVGDWEHMMVRFANEKPSIVYYSQHSGGVAYTYDAVLKNGSRPLGFASKGGHATYAQEGIHVMYAGAANDSTSRGPLWDPVAGSGAWFYTFTPNTTDGSDGVFQAIDVANHTARGTGPVEWLHYFGRWGDKQYNSSYPGQNSLLNIASVFEDGPTGPLDKDLYRSGACPDDSGSCVTSSSIPASSGTSISQTVSRTYTSTAASTTTPSTSSSSTAAAATPSSNSAVKAFDRLAFAAQVIQLAVVLGLIDFLL